MDESLSAFVDNFTELLTRTESKTEAKEEYVHSCVSVASSISLFASFEHCTCFFWYTCNM